MRMTRKRHRQQERKRLNKTTITKVLNHFKSVAAMTALWAALSIGEIYALPQDGSVTAGSAAITQNGNNMSIQQMTDKVAINWQSFSIGANEKVAFYQPNAQSVALNRIVGNNASTVYGQLSANGKVFLVNPNGVLFAPGSEVSVGGLAVSTLGISDSDFMRGNYVFAGGSGQGTVVNQGNLTAKDGGYVVLIGNQVSNSGTISATGGTVAMAAGGKVLLDAPGDGLINLVVNQSAANAAVQNSGTIQANGGQVLLTGQAGGDMLFSVINNSGMISAKSVQEKNGVIILDGGAKGTVDVSGTLDVSGQEIGQSGGTVKILGNAIKLQSGAKVDATGVTGGGEVLIGGNWQGQGTEAHAASVLMEKGAAIQADTLQSGDGGKVVLWSDEQTQFYGTITAKGGSAGGNGGMVETSGKDYLAADGSVNVSAANGKGGTWLLDPRNITIQSSGDSYADPSYSPAGDNATVNVNSINTALNGGSNVVITTGTAGTQDGNITVAANISKTGGSEATLTLSAANNIIVKENTGITSTSGKLNVNLDADHDGQYSGIIQMQSGSSIVTNGGNITMYGQGNAVTGYARSATTASQGIQLQGTTLNAGGGSITLRGENTATVSGVAKGNAISLTGTNNQLLTSGSGTITLIGKAGEDGINITDTSAQFSAGSSSIVLTADRMALAGKIGGESGDTGTLTLQPFSSTTSIGIGGGAGTLQLDDAVFSSVIQSSLSKVTIGRNDLAAAIDIGAVTFRNNMNFLAAGTLPATGAAGEIKITGDVLNSGKTITLDSVQGTTTGHKITAGSLELLGNNAGYSFTNTGNAVGTLAANAGTLVYTGGTLTVGTVGLTNGLNLSGTGSVTTGTSDLTVSQNIATGGDLALSGKNVTIGSGTTIVTTNDKITLTAGTGGTVTLNGSIDSNGGNIALSGPATTLNNGSVIASDGGDISMINTGAVQLKGTSVNSNNGALIIEGSSITASNTNTINGGTGAMTFTANTMNLPAGNMTVTGTGIVTVQSLTPTRSIDVGDSFNADASHLQLASQLFASSGAFGSTSFSMLNIGRTNGSGTLQVGSNLSFASPTTLRTGDSGTVSLTATAAINNTATNKALTIEAGTINSAAGAAVTSGVGLLTLSGNSMNFNASSSIATGNGGSLLIKPKNGANTVGLGSGTGNLQLTDTVFASVFKPGFSDITVQGSSITADALTRVKDNLTLQSTTGSITLNGDLKVAGGKTITLEAKTSASQTGGSITADGLQLLGSGAVYTLEQSSNQVGKLAANTGSVSFKGQNVTVDTVSNTAHSSVAGISATGNVTLESAAGTILTQNASIGSSEGDITLTADTMAFNSGQLSGHGKLQIQPLTQNRPVDIGSFTVNPAHLQLASSLFNSGVRPGFNKVIIGRDNGTGTLTAAGQLSFVNPTLLQSPTTSGSIVLASDVDLSTTGGKGLWLTAGSVTAAAGAQITASGDVNLTADVMDLGDGAALGSTITGQSGGTLYLRPLQNSTFIDLGTNLTAMPNHLQFNNAMFNGNNDGDYKVFTGFGKYTIGGTVTNTVKVDGTAHFAGDLEIQSPTLQLTANGNLDPTGKVVLRNDDMIFADGAKVTGSGDLTLTPYTAGHGMMIGTIIGSPTETLTISRGAFTGEGRTGGAVFTGTYDGTLTFGDAAVARDITINDMMFDHTNTSPSSAFTNLQNLQILTQEAGTAAINNSVLTIKKDITVQAGTITTGTGTAITSTSGDITLTGHALNLNSGTNTIKGSKNLYLRPYNATDSIAVGDASLTAALKLPQGLFYTASSSGALSNEFSHITIGRTDGSGAVQIKDAAFQNDLTILSPGGSIALTGNISDPGKNITLNAANITQTGGVITTTGLELLGGIAALTNANQVDRVAANVNDLTFRNGKALTIGTVNTTTGVTTTGNADVASTVALTVNEAVVSGGDILLSGTALALNNNITDNSGTGDITLTGDTMTVSTGVKVTGNDQLKIQTLAANKNIGFGGSADSSLELTNTWFNPGSSQVFQDGFNMITIGRDNGSGTVTVDNPVTFSDAVTLQAPGAGGKVVMASTGFINNSATNQNITLKGTTIETQTDSKLNGGSGTVTLQGDSMTFTGGSITGSQGHLIIKPLADTTAITVGGSTGSGLVLDASAFNGDSLNNIVIKNEFADITIGSQQQSGAITVNDFAVGTDLELLSQAANGTITVNGTVNTTGKNLTVKAAGDINGAAGTFSNIGTLSAASTTGAITFSNPNNTISQLGTMTAAKGISLFNNQALTLTGNVTGNTLGAAGTANSVLIRTKGDLTLSGDVLVKTQGGADIYLTAEGQGSQFFNDSSKGAQAVSAGGRWLIYSHSPLATSADTEPAATNRYNGLTSDFRRYNVTYDSAAPTNTTLVPAGENGFLYEYQPILAITSASRTYGDGNTTIQFTYNGLLAGDTIADLLLTGAPKLDYGTNAAITETSAAGTAYWGTSNPYLLNFTEDTVTAEGTHTSQYSLQGYKIVNADYIPLTINKRPLIITPTSVTKTYDGLINNMPTSTYTGNVVTGDTLIIGLTGAYTTTPDAGAYTITATPTITGNPGDNYQITTNTGTYTINKAPLTVIVDNQEKIYGDANPPAPTPVVSGFVNGETAASLSAGYYTAPVATHTALWNSAVGAYDINASGGSAKNYTFTYTPGKLTITPREITVTVDAGQKKVYGENDPAKYSYTATNTVNNDVLNLTRDTGENVGQYAIKLGDNENYTVTTFNPANFEITKRPLTITANNASRYYGYADPVFGFTAQTGSVGSGTGLVKGDTVGSVSFSNLLDQYSSAGTTGDIKINNAIFSSGTIGNYEIFYNPGTLTITKAPLTITANDANRIYGDSNPTFTASYSGFKNGDTQDVVTGLQLATQADIASNVGGYDITAANGQAQNYTFTYVNGTLIINPRHIGVISDPNQTKVYGQNNPGTYTYTTINMVNNDTLAGALGRATGENAGTYNFNLGSLNNSNYVIDSLSGPGFVITPATLTVAADYAHKVYGTNDPAALTYKATGFVENTSLDIHDSAALLTGSLSRTSGENVGEYAISKNTLSAGNNYTINYTGNKLAITPAELVIKANTGSKTYGDEDPALTYQATGLVTNAALGIDDSAGLNGQLSRDSGENAGGYQINQGTVNLKTDQLKNNYNVTYQGNLFTINKADLTITANDANRIYGDSNPAFTASYSGFKNGDSQNVVSGLQLATLAEIASNVGSYDITAANGQAQNYNITFVNGKLTITPRHIGVISDPNQTKVYGQNNPGTYTYTTTNMVNNDTLAGALDRATGENAGTYNFNLGSLNNSNYVIDSLSGPGFVITPATLTVAADYAHKVYGTNDPAALTYKATGFVENTSLDIHDSAALLTGSLSRTSGENVGEYAISKNTLSAGNNYTINYTGNKLAITPAELVIKANTGSKTYGDEDPALTYQATGLVTNAALGIDDSAGLNGQLSRDSGENAGGYQINQGTVDLKTEQLKNNYNVSYESNLFTINKADLTITANDANRIYGDSNPALTASYSGFKNGENQNVVSGLQLATAADIASNVGSYDITAANGQAQNYNITFVNGKLVITPAMLTYVADLRERKVGQANPDFTGSITGFKNQDNLTNATTGTAGFISPATTTSPTGLYAINGEGLTANYGNYVFVQAPSNATALTIKGLDGPGQGAVDDTHGYHPTPPTSPGSTVGGGSTVNIGFNGNGAVTVGLASDANDIGDLTPRKEGISLPVFTRDGSGVSPEGLYDVSYNQTRLTVLPSGQNVPPPPVVASSNTPYAPFDLKIGDSTVSFSVQAVNGVVLVTPLSDESKQILQKNDKNTNKLILANALLTAINELSVMPDQLLAVLLATE
jgi:filamentous hemagglutinin family protein